MRTKKDNAVIGLSLSQCVLDIAMGRVSLSEVSYIIAGTCIRDDADWDDAIDQYSASKWAGVEAKAKIIVDALRKMDLIQQPRLIGNPPPNLSLGHWVLDQHCWED